MRLLHDLRRNAAPAVEVGAVAISVALVALANTPLSKLAFVRGYTDDATFCLLGLLCCHVILKDRRVPAALRDLHERIETALPARVLTTGDALYLQATCLVGKADRRIRATAFGESDPLLREPYLDAIARRAKDAAGRHAAFDYRVVFDRFDDSSARPGKVSARLAAFAAVAAGPALEMRRLRTGGGEWDVDLLIVDDRHMLIAFLDRHRKLLHGVAIENNPDFVAPLCDWYDQSLWRERSETFP